MLVMRRRVGDAILIGEDIQIEIIEVSPNRVKLGIIAPATLPVIRKEILITKQQNVAASQHVSGPNLSRLLEQLTFEKPRGVNRLTMAAQNESLQKSSKKN